MDIETLKMIKGDTTKFLHNKAKDGIRAYTFLEACQYLGYDNACKKAAEYIRSVNQSVRSCLFTKEYLDIHADGFRFTIKGPDGLHEEIVVDMTGKVVGVDFVDYRTYEASFGKENIKITHRKARISDENYTINDQVKRLSTQWQRFDTGGVSQGQ